ncbi:MAG TPA: hypothetical protein VN616_14425 [Puia sp.]|nr:hypothetical protein [Puia sp.]
MNRRPAILFVAAMLFTACNSGKDPLRARFDSIDNSLGSANARATGQNALAVLHETIRQKKERNPALAARADTVYQLVSDATNMLEGCRTNLRRQDIIGRSTAPAARLLVHTALGDSLQKMLILVASLDSMPNEDPYLHESDWSVRYFENTPTVAALTILAKFESDCRKAGSNALTKINNRL